MYRNVGGKLKAFASIIIGLGVLYFVVTLTITLSSTRYLGDAAIWISLLSAAASLLGLWLLSLVLYALGEISQSTERAEQRQEQAERISEERWAMVTAWMGRFQPHATDRPVAAHGEPSVQSQPRRASEPVQPQEAAAKGGSVAQAGISVPELIGGRPAVECPVCHTVQRADRKVCYSCGLAFTTEGLPASVTPAVCHTCNSPVANVQDEFCSNCGAQLQRETVPEIPDHSGISAAVDRRMLTLVCPLCGERQPSNLDVCRICGARFTDA